MSPALVKHNRKHLQNGNFLVLNFVFMIVTFLVLNFVLMIVLVPVLKVATELIRWAFKSWCSILPVWYIL